MEETSFSKYFRKHTGVRFRDWVSIERVLIAAQLMDSRDLTLTEISQAVGFRDLRSFERTVKRWTGITPRVLRDRVQQRPSPTLGSVGSNE
jgi:AraC-like DNA-binding protein